MQIYECDYLVKKILGTNREEIEKILAVKKDAYVDFELPKKGGTRPINGINKNEYGKKLANLQRKLYRNFLARLPLASPAKGFGSISSQIISDTLSNYVQDNDALEIIFQLCTIEDKIPQGAVTSPALSNVIFARIDQRILKYCQSVEERHKAECLRRKKEAGNANIRYTRYADDLLFSSDFLDFEENIYFFRMIAKILRDNGFRVNRKKTVISRDEIVMNGYVVGRCIRLSRSKITNVKKILYYFRDKKSELYSLDKSCFSDRKVLLSNINQLGLCVHGEEKKFKDIRQLTYYLSGCRSWIISVLQAEDIPFREVKDLQKTIRRIELLLEKLQILEE